MSTKYPHDLSQASASGTGVPIMNCVNPGCNVVWWPERKKPNSICPGAMLLAIAADLLAQVQARVGEMDGLSGCEAGAARAYERGRFDVVTEQMWKVLGLPGLGAAEVTPATTAASR